MHERTSLPVTTPERVGIPSSRVVRFIDRLAEKRLCMHGFLMLRHGAIFAEGYYHPFTGDRLHRIYSISKTFVSIAVGLLADERRLHLTDHIAGYFQELLPTEAHPHILNMTIRDLLMMATPFNDNTYRQHDANWVWTFFNTPVSHPPGTLFAYNTGATVTLTALVEKITGMPLLAYLRMRILDEIGFSKEAWCIKRPEGGSWGGSGIVCAPRDLARFALVLLNKGRWGDQQLISESYVTEATSKQIDNRVSVNYPELSYGYGYQVWRTRHNGFALLGMGSQYAVCLPDKDFILITTADTQAVETGYCDILDALWNEIYPALSHDALPGNPEEQRQLSERLARLEPPPVSGNATSSSMDRFNGQIYLLDQNPMGIRTIRFTFTNTHGRMEYVNRSGEHCIEFGFRTYHSGKFPEDNYYGEQIGKTPGIRYECIASAAWENERSLVIYVYIIDAYLGTLKIHVAFGENEISLLMAKAAEWFLDEYQGFAGGRAVREAGSGGEAAGFPRAESDRPSSAS